MNKQDLARIVASGKATSEQWDEYWNAQRTDKEKANAQRELLSECNALRAKSKRESFVPVFFLLLFLPLFLGCVGFGVYVHYAHVWDIPAAAMTAADQFAGVGWIVFGVLGIVTLANK